MKRALVYTFSETLDNYGQVLQYLATQIFFEKSGVEASVLRISPHKRNSLLVTLFKKILKAIVLFLNKFRFRETPLESFFKQAKRITIENEKAHPRFFEDFRKKYFKITTCSNLKTTPPLSDIYCVGSDQTWSWCGADNFLDFGPPSIRRISLAPSFGAYTPREEHEWAQIKERLSKFDYISVREPSGKAICAKVGRNDVDVINDPTLLIEPDDLVRYEEPPTEMTEEYLFLYLLGNTTEGLNMKAIYDFAEREHLKVVYVASQGRADNYPKMYATIPQWLYCLRHAKYVITNSFHGTTLAILFHRQFLVYRLAEPFSKMNERVTFLLDTYFLSDRQFSGEIDRVKYCIDFNAVDCIRKDLTTKVHNQLSRYL